MQAAFDKASDLTADRPNSRDAMIAVIGTGTIHFRKGELWVALQAYEAGLMTARDLAAHDPGNADWAFDVWVAVWRMAFLDTENAAL